MEQFKELFEASSTIQKLGKKLAKLTEYNNHAEAYLAIAEFLDEKDKAKTLKSIIADRDRIGHNKRTDESNEIYQSLMKIGKRKFGDDDWNKFVYQNT